ITEAFVRWLAPILSFTADEIWRYLPGKREASVFLSQWFEAFPPVTLDAKEREQWALLLKIRDEVNKALEASRNAGKIGSALEAEVLLFADGETHAALATLGDELRFVLITSAAKVFSLSQKPNDAITTEIPGLALRIVVVDYAKCARCWQRVADVGQNKEHP